MIVVSQLSLNSTSKIDLVDCLKAELLESTQQQTIIVNGSISMLHYRKTFRIDYR